MNDEEIQLAIEELQGRLLQLEQWQAARKKQQLVMPVDTISKQALGAVLIGGLGSKTTTQSIGSVPATVVKLFTGTIIINTPNGQFEIPYY